MLSAKIDTKLFEQHFWLTFYFNNIPERHRPMWIYTMYAGMSTGKYNDK